jgi:hypothetical protein
MRNRSPIVISWFVFILDLVALGVAWAEWKAPHAEVLVGLIATTIVIVATGVAGRILVVVTRAGGTSPTTSAYHCGHPDGRVPVGSFCSMPPGAPRAWRKREKL